MVITKNASVVHPFTKECNKSTTIMPRRRFCETSSVHYRTMRSKSPTPHFPKPNSHYQSFSIQGEKKGAKEKHPQPRRVRFNLPSTDGSGDIDGDDVVDGKSVVKSASSGDGWIRAQVPIISQQLESQRLQRPRRRRSPTIYSLHHSRSVCVTEDCAVPITASPGVRNRIYPTGKYHCGTLSPTANASPHAAASPNGLALLKAARDGEDHLLRDLLRRAVLVGVAEGDLNATDSSGRTILSYVASNGSIDVLEQILQLPGLDPNKPDNEGNTPLHFAAQAGQIECLNCMLSRCRAIEIDARNNLGFTALMKAALQGRNKCAKLLLFAGANPTLRDNGRGFRADQWARFCGRYVCADVIEKHARQRLLERSTSYGNWGGDNEIAARVLMGKVVPVPPVPPPQSHGLKSKLRKVFRTSSGPNNSNDSYSSARLVTQLTSAALCASTPVLPSGPTVPPVVKSLIRPLTVPRLQITLVNNNCDLSNNNNNNISNGISKQTAAVTFAEDVGEEKTTVVKPLRAKKAK